MRIQQQLRTKYFTAKTSDHQKAQALVEAMELRGVQYKHGSTNLRGGEHTFTIEKTHFDALADFLKD